MVAKKDGTARKPARTIEQQVADLLAKKDAQQARATAKATKALASVTEKIGVAEAKLGELYVELAEAQAVLGIDTVEAESQAEAFLPDPTV